MATELSYCSCNFPFCTGKFANCAPEISKIYYKIYREYQNCATKILVAQYKLSRLVNTHNNDILGRERGCKFESHFLDCQCSHVISSCIDKWSKMVQNKFQGCFQVH